MANIGVESNVLDRVKYITICPRKISARLFFALTSRIYLVGTPGTSEYPDNILMIFRGHTHPANHPRYITRPFVMYASMVDIEIFLVAHPLHIFLRSYLVTWIPSARPDWVKADIQRERDRPVQFGLKFQCHRNVMPARYAHNNGNTDNYSWYSFPSCRPLCPLLSSVEIVHRFRSLWKRSRWPGRRPWLCPRAYRRAYSGTDTYTSVRSRGENKRRAARLVSRATENRKAVRTRWRVLYTRQVHINNDIDTQQRRAFFFTEYASDLFLSSDAPRDLRAAARER